MPNIADKYADIKTDLFKKEYKHISKIYIDLEALLDFKFGALLSFITTKIEMEYVLHNLKRYNDRIIDNITDNFKALHISEQQILDYIADPKNTYKLCVLSQWTSYYYSFLKIMTDIVYRNRMFTSSPNNFDITLNCEVVDYPKELLIMFENYLKKCFGEVHITYTHYKRYEDDVHNYLINDVLFLYGMEEFVKPGAKPSLAFCQENAFFNKLIYAIPFINPDLNIDFKDYGYAINSSAACFDLCCDFVYLRSMILKYKE